LLSIAQAGLLRALSIGDERSLQALSVTWIVQRQALDQRVACLVRLAAVISTDAALPAYQREVQHSLDAGASTDEILDVLASVAAQVGSSRVITAAPKLAMALGYDVEQGLEDLADTYSGERTEHEE
jgi:4-carboxymuconolactone decarboxylase